MFKEIFLFDLKYNFKKVQTYIFFGIFFTMTLFGGLFAAGVLGTATSDTNSTSNSAYAVADLIVGLNSNFMVLINGIILVAIMATGIHKDYEFNTHPFYFTKPINKLNYFFGRYFSAVTTAAFVFSGNIIGYYIGCLFGMGTPQMGAFHLMNFIEPFMVFTFQNILLLGIIFFSLTTFTRNTLIAYLFCIILLVIEMTTASMSANIDNKITAAILEPFGSAAFNYITQYWTPTDQNTKMIPLQGALLYNRLLWLGIAVIITIGSYFKFSFSQFLAPISLFKNKNKAEVVEQNSIQSLALLPKVSQNFSTKESWKQLLYLSKFEFLKMVKTAFFIIICALGIVTMFIFSKFMGAIYGTSTYPVTYQILESVSGFFMLFILILVIFFSGTIIWRERDQKADELIGATPVNNTVLFFSKYLSLIYVVAVLLLLTMLTGIAIQLYNGFYDVHPMEYVQELFGFRLAGLVITIGLCLALQVFTPNKYLGFFLPLIPIILFNAVLFPLIQWKNELYFFNSSGPSMAYSDMNGFGHIVGTFILYKTYWLSITMVLILVALLFFARGKEKSLKAKFKLSKGSFNGKYKLALALSMLIAVSCGGYIFYNTNILHRYTTPKQDEMDQAAFEKMYKKYEKTPQLRIVSSDVNVDIFPKERSTNVQGFYYLKNKHAFPVDTLFVNYRSDNGVEYHYTQLEPSVAYSTVLDDKEYGVKLMHLTTPVQPGDSIKFSYKMQYKPVGFKNGSTETSIVHNGTFFNSEAFPSIGYDPNMELGSNDARKKYGLPFKPRMAKVDDSVARMNTYISNDADWIRFETTVSTSVDQIAIAPGYLQKEWIENGRHYFNYKMDCPILNFYDYNSAKYEVLRDKWKDVNIEIYYQKGHEYNLDRMVKSIKKAMDYYTANYGPYQFRQVRILEFPRYNSFAQSFPNTIPFSESIGFIAKVDDADNDKIDVPFYVTAHEVAHQWWAHQVIGGNVQGSTLLSETMSQYSALMVMEKEYGKQAMKKFLKYEMNTYLRGRAQEKKGELPLMLCENQQYIHYNKGSVVMYAMRDYLGEAVLNKAIRDYLNHVKFQEPPYTNSVEFVNYLRAATPDSLKYIIHDMFETITLYENYTKDLSYVKTADGKYKVTLTVGSVKYRSDSTGKNTPVAVNDYIDIGVFGKKMVNGKNVETELYLQKVKMDKPIKTFEIIVNDLPISAGIDPYNKLIDRTPDNNTWKFGTKPPKVDTDVKSNAGATTEVNVSL